MTILHCFVSSCFFSGAAEVEGKTGMQLISLSNLSGSFSNLHIDEVTSSRIMKLCKKLVEKWEDDLVSDLMEAPATGPSIKKQFCLAHNGPPSHSAAALLLLLIYPSFCF